MPSPLARPSAAVTAMASQPPSPGQERAAADFLADALRHSGIDYRQCDPETAEYRVLMPDYTLRGGLRAEARLELAGQTIVVSQLIGCQLAYSREQLINAVRSTDSFTALRALLKELGAVVRYLHDEHERLVGLVLPAAVIMKVLDAIERGEVAAPNEPSLIEQVTRQFGLRRKVMLLDYERRTRWVDPLEESFIGTLGRTISRLR